MKKWFDDFKKNLTSYFDLKQKGVTKEIIDELKYHTKDFSKEQLENLDNAIYELETLHYPNKNSLDIDEYENPNDLEDDYKNMLEVYEEGIIEIVNSI